MCLKVYYYRKKTRQIRLTLLQNHLPYLLEIKSLPFDNPILKDHTISVKDTDQTNVAELV